MMDVQDLLLADAHIFVYGTKDGKKFFSQPLKLNFWSEIIMIFFFHRDINRF